MSIDKILDEILKKGSGKVKGEVLDLIKDAKEDEVSFIKNLGKKLESYIKKLAGGKIDQDEFKDLVSGLADLQVMEAAKLSVKAKVRAEKIIKDIKNFVQDALLGALKTL
jgi:hypothetical protein